MAAARERYFTRARLPLVLFDFATATISVVDVATDALVILEYRAMGADAARPSKVNRQVKFDADAEKPAPNPLESKAS